MKEWAMPKLEREKKEGELVRLPYHYKFKKYFKAPCQEWLETIKVMSTEILGNYSKKEDQLMTAAFGTRPKRRTNRVLDAIGFEYPDYERLDKGAEGQKRKRVASTLIKDDEDQPKKKKEKFEPKVVAPRKRKAASPKPASPKPASPKPASPEPATPEPERLVRDEKVPATPSAAEVEEILKVMTESLPVKLSPLAPELTKFFQKDKEASAAESPAKPKKRRIIQVTDVIHQTPPPVSASKIVVAETAEAKAAATEATGAEITEIAPAGAEATGAEAEATEDSNLETTLEVIDNILLKMTEEEAAVAAVNTTTEKGKEQIDEISEEEDFNFQDLLGQELTDAEKKS
jgi:hypothetical protein